MKLFWFSSGQGVPSDQAKEADLDEVREMLSEQMNGEEGNFFGLVDDAGRTIQFAFEEGIPDHVEDASHLEIVTVDFPVPEKSGSYQQRITIGEIQAWVEKAFRVGADPEQFGDLPFVLW